LQLEQGARGEVHGELISVVLSFAPER
jgi:hypothetical protein